MNCILIRQMRYMYIAFYMHNVLFILFNFLILIMTNSIVREQSSRGKRKPLTHSLNELSDIDWYLLGLVDTKGVSSKKLFAYWTVIGEIFW